MPLKCLSAKDPVPASDATTARTLARTDYRYPRPVTSLVPRPFDLGSDLVTMGGGVISAKIGNEIFCLIG